MSSSNSFVAKFLRFIGIVLMALTGGFTLLGGIGTSCAAFNPTGFGESMAPLAKLQWLYILFVLTGIVIGVYGIRATIMLIKGSDKSYRNALYTLIAGVVVGFIHIYVSRMLRGKSMPVDAVVYTTLLTMIIFLLFRIPYLWNGLNFNKGSDKTSHIAGGSAAILLGMFTLTIQYTMASTHTWGGINFANAFSTTMLVVGAMLVLIGTGYILRLFNIRIIKGRSLLNPQRRALQY